ncbi:hypothetical protein [Photobacterium galatheae]|uniref:Tail fiber assembly protein n=1 Tax=Photobacterium galatheae TaxID=1654360 RepID=A0A066RZT1_9GAMM|nr:hypothetical protein [Photobacterium galatheae]KDM92903.1 hypothetical protein EA58_03870 [Photobacterium galatheae]MCM0148132.1 hypothetical protein [Photobacterium galatheae]
MIIYGYSITNGRYIEQATAHPDEMNPGEFLIPGYHTPTAPPENGLQPGEFFSYRDESGNIPRCWQHGGWEIRTEPVQVTAWQMSSGRPKQFDDVSSVPDDYTTEQPETQFDYWTETGWQTDEQARFEADVKAVNDIRRRKYAQISDPLLSESLMLRELGEVTVADATKLQALEWYEKIKLDHPWPEPPAAPQS